MHVNMYFLMKELGTFYVLRITFLHLVAFILVLKCLFHTYTAHTISKFFTQ